MCPTVHWCMHISYPMRILGIVFLYSSVKHLLRRICHALNGKYLKRGSVNVRSRILLRLMMSTRTCPWRTVMTMLRTIPGGTWKPSSTCKTQNHYCQRFFSPAEEAPAAKSSVLLCSSVADRSSSSSSSGLTVGFLQQSLGGFDRKPRLRSGEEGFPYMGHLGDSLGLSSSEMLTVGCCCAWASPAYQLTLQDLKPWKFDFLADNLLKSHHVQWFRLGLPWSSPGSKPRTGFSSTGAALSSPEMFIRE